MKEINKKSCDNANNFKLNYLHEIIGQCNILKTRYQNITDISRLANDIGDCLSTFGEQLRDNDTVIRDLRKKVSVFESKNIAYKKSNLTLIAENCELKSKLLKVQESCKEDIRQLKCSNKKLKSDLDDLEFVYSHTLRALKELERQSLRKNSKIAELAHSRTAVLNTDGKKKIVSINRPVLEISKPLKEQGKCRNKLWESKTQAHDTKVINMVEVMDRKCTSLGDELHRVKQENKRQADLIWSLKRQIKQKDEEMERLRKSLENDQPPNEDYCCHCHQLKCKIGKLEMQLTETIEKQHEAMTRAVQLAERNRNLERELKDIDQMAMAVEEECQTKIKENARCVSTLQEKIAAKVDEIKILQSEVTDLKIRLDKEKLTVEKLNLEKKSMERNLEDAIKEKKCLNDKINHYIILERNLKMEITKLQELNKSLQRQINDFEGKLGDTLGQISKGKDKLKPKRKNPTLSLPSHCRVTSSHSGSKFENTLNHHKHCDKDIPLQHCVCYRENLGLEECEPCHWENSMGINYYRKLNEMEQEIETLKQENTCLKRQKAARSKLEDDCSHCQSGDSLKIMLDRVERERDLALSDVTKLQTERDILRERIKLSTESQLGENSRMERILLENEERIRRLESERRELISNQGSQRASLSALEEKCDEYKNQLLSVQNELTRITTHYNQLKVLQEETDRSLAEVHGRLSHTQTELNLSLNKVKEVENKNRDLEDQITVLKREKSALKSSLAFIEREKDDLLMSLDEKTEVCSKQQGELKNRDKYIAELNEKISELQKKFDFILNEKTAREHSVLNLERDVQHLRDELEKCENQREAFKRENRRLQDDLTSAIKDCHLARRQLENEKKEVENLKRQLQQYVNEVKRAEELLFKKESERNEMLDHFRSLSIEATNLESNNQTLESAVETTKVELIAANNRLMDLEQEIATKESLVNSYENQIVDLTARVAELEIRLKEETEERCRIEEDLVALRDLCSTIDGQKESLRRQANDSDAEKLHLLNEVQRLNEEYEGLNHKLAHERTLAQTLEKSLSHSRQETLEHKITNKDLQAQVQQLRLKIEELTEKLESESQNVQKYQNQCADLSSQVSELRREVTNARFEKARALDSSRRSCCENESPIRGIPPLVFLEDSDRTISDEEETSRSYKNNPHRITFLSPILEGSKLSKLDISDDTSSDLSSMPGDQAETRERGGLCGCGSYPSSVDQTTYICEDGLNDFSVIPHVDRYNNFNCKQTRYLFHGDCVGNACRGNYRDGVVIYSKAKGGIDLCT